MLEWVVIIGLTLFFALSISFSRIYCGMHSVTDIIGGWLVGAALLAFWMYSFDKIENWMLYDPNGKF